MLDVVQHVERVLKRAQVIVHLVESMGRVDDVTQEGWY